MSWDAYTAALLAYPDVSAAGIYGHNGGVWSQNQMTASPEEILAFVARFQNPRTGAKLVVDGKQFIATLCTEEFLTGRNKQGVGLAVVMSSMAVLVVQSGEGCNPGNALNAVTKMADDLKSKNF